MYAIRSYYEDLDISQVDDFGSIVAEAADDFEIDTEDGEDVGDQFAASDAPIIKLVNGSYNFV